MKIFARLFLVSLSLPWLGLVSQSLVKATETPVVPIFQGVTISFIEARQVVQKVWLDNPRWLTLDTDGCLDGLGYSTGRGEEHNRDGQCKQQGATSIHLRRIKPLPISGLLPSENSLLTVISRDFSGKLMIHTFNLVPSPSAEETVIRVANPLNSADLRIDTALVRRGRDEAIAQGWMRAGDPLSRKIDRFLVLCHTEPVNSAIVQSGVSVALVQRLVSLGAGNGTNSSPSYP